MGFILLCSWLFRDRFTGMRVEGKMSMVYEVSGFGSLHNCITAMCSPVEGNGIKV
jgi:hypothetical protein